ncbi:MAG: PadR family transcriptional regulator [Bacillota bacterium]
MVAQIQSGCPLDTRVLVRGFLAVSILHFLESGPSFGADIARMIEITSRGNWSPSPGSVYPLLRRLEQEGLIEGQWDRGHLQARKVYDLTDHGRSELAKLRAEIIPQLNRAIRTLQSHVEFLSAPMSARPLPAE